MADSDRPGGMLEISRSLERDLDRAAAGRIPAPPLEAFMSDAALQAAQDATRASAGPVRAEDLTAISAAEAARRTTFGGEHLPPVPATRRVVPAPYRRQRVTGGRHGKTWQYVPAGQVVPGDMTEVAGLVASVVPQLRRQEVAGVGGVATGTDILITGAGGTAVRADAAAQVRVFRA